jgi:hypothetical protein
MIKKLSTVAVALVVSASSFAADKETVLSNVQMPVMINQGSSYVEATESMFLYAGDRVMVLEGGSAQLNYASGCVQSLGSNEVSQIDSTGDTCNTMAAAGTHQQAVGSSGGTGLAVGNSTLVTVAIVGAIVVGAAVVAENNDSSGGSSRPPASP